MQCLYVVTTQSTQKRNFKVSQKKKPSTEDSRIQTKNKDERNTTHSSLILPFETDLIIFSFHKINPAHAFLLKSLPPS
jgi:hypothetical protein